MGQFGRIARMADMPSRKILPAYITEAMRLNEGGFKVQRPTRKHKPVPRVPGDLAAALKNNHKAAAPFRAFGPTNRREYIDWITGAKRAEIRAQRLSVPVK